MSRAGDILGRFNEADFDDNDMKLLRSRINNGPGYDHSQVLRGDQFTYQVKFWPDELPGLEMSDPANIDFVEEHIHNVLDSLGLAAGAKVMYDDPIWDGWDESGKSVYRVELEGPDVHVFRSAVEGQL